MPPVDVMRPEPDPRNQQPLDLDFTVLIVPDAIPIPGTSAEVLQTAASNLLTAAGEVAEGGGSVESSWQALQAHYTAPESETLFAAMGPVARKGDTILDDVTTVVGALETFAEAAQTAQTRLRSLRGQAVDFVEAMRDKEFWAINPVHYNRNRGLKLSVNSAWATFQEAERECATAISSVNGQNNAYVAAGEGAPGPREIVYGLDPGDVPDITFDLTEFSEWQRFGQESWDHLSNSEKPWPLDWAADAYVAQQENFGVGMLWGVGVGIVSATGLWREGSGWASSLGEAGDNFVTHKQEMAQGLGSLAGLYGDDGWMNPFDSEERSGATWRANAGEAWTEVGHDLVPWREWEDRPAYTVSTAGGNLALAVVAFPARGGMMLSRIGGGPDVPDIALVDRPGVTWDVGAAGRPGFSLAGSLGGIRSGFADTADGIGLRLEQLKLGVLGRFTDWSVTEGAPGRPGRPVEVLAAGEGERAGPGEDAGAGAERPDAPGPVEQVGEETGVGRPREDAGAATVVSGRGDELSTPEVVAAIERVSDMSDAERERFLRSRVLVGSDGMEIGDANGPGDRPDADFRITAAHNPDPDSTSPTPTPHDSTTPPPTALTGDANSVSHGSGPEGAPQRLTGGTPFLDVGDADAPPVSGEAEMPRVVDATEDAALDANRSDTQSAAVGGEDNRSEDRSTAIEEFGLGTRNGTYPELFTDKLPTAEPMLLREFASRGRILGEVTESMVTGRDSQGLIREINGADLTTWLEKLVTHRGSEMVDFQERHGLSDASLGKKGGAVNSIVIDRRTGLVAEGFNGHRNGTKIPEREVHHLVAERIEAMRRFVDPERGLGYPQYGSDGVLLRYTAYPHGDEPTRHAEVKALNRLLWARGEGVGESALEEFQLDNRYTLKEGSAAGKCPCCANCYRITSGVPAPRTGKNTHMPFDGACELVGRDGSLDDDN